MRATARARLPRQERHLAGDRRERAVGHRRAVPEAVAELAADDPDAAGLGRDPQASSSVPRLPKPCMACAPPSPATKAPTCASASSPAQQSRQDCPLGVTQAPSRRNYCGCSAAKGHADVSRIQANGRAAWATTSTTASPAKTAAPPRQTSHPLSPSPEQDRPLADHRRLCKQASGSKLVRWWTAAHQRRPGVIWSADRTFTVPVSDIGSHANAVGGKSCASTKAGLAGRDPRDPRIRHLRNRSGRRPPWRRERPVCGPALPREEEPVLTRCWLTLADASGESRSPAPADRNDRAATFAVAVRRRHER
jgi:hypothetical protein